jgi:hypothetical protein
MLFVIPETTSLSLVRLIKAARAEEVEVNRVKHAIVNTLDLAINKIGSDKQACVCL